MRMPRLTLIPLACLGLTFVLMCQPWAVEAYATQDSDRQEVTPEFVRETVGRLMSGLPIPGAVVALIGNSGDPTELAFGVDSNLSRHAITRDAVFEGASMGKPIAAYIALTLVKEGKLQLDAPLVHYIKHPWLANFPNANNITLRHVLSHTSGLPNEVWHRTSKLSFTPGERFQYSGNGYQYLQYVLEELAGTGLEQLAEKRVFQPLGMTSSSYSLTPQLAERAVNGHVPLGLAVTYYLKFAAYSCGVALGVSILVFLVPWWRRYRLWIVGGLIVAAAFGAIIPFVYFFGVDGLLFFGGLTLVILTLVAIATALGLLVMRALPSVHPARFALPLLFAAGALALFIKLTADAWVPVPLTFSHNVDAASSLQTTAGDLAKFASELMQPMKLDAEIIRQMRTPQVVITERDSWGLGIGIQTDSSGTSLWQWGDNPGFQSLLVVYPAKRQGVVVMTNSWAGLYLAREFAKTLFNAQGSWKIP